jgi:hypothetical protein
VREFLRKQDETVPARIVAPRGQPDREEETDDRQI